MASFAGRQDAHTVGLGDSDFSSSPANPLANLSSASGDGAGGASSGVFWTNSPTRKEFRMTGAASSLSGAGAATVDFGSTKFQQTADIGNLIDLNIVADPGEVAGTPILVRIGYKTTGEGAASSGQFEVRYASEKAGPFVNTLGSGALGPSANSVTISTEIGRTISIGLKGRVTAGPSGSDDTIVNILDVLVDATLLPGGPPPPPVGLSPVSIVGYRQVANNKGIGSVVLKFNGPLDASTATNLAAYSIFQRPKANSIISALYNASANQVTLRLKRRIAARDTAILRAYGTVLRDTAGRMIGGENKGTPGLIFEERLRVKRAKSVG